MEVIYKDIQSDGKYSVYKMSPLKLVGSFFLGVFITSNSNQFRNLLSNEYSDDIANPF